MTDTVPERNQAMKKFVIIASVLAALFCSALPAASADTSVLPDSLTLLDAEALAGTAVDGVLNLSGTGITEIADGALDGLSLQGLILPASVASVGRQNFAYGPVWVWVNVNEDCECEAEDLNGLGNVPILISDIGNAGKISGSRYCYYDEIALVDGFLYEVCDGTSTLLCAYDNTAVPSEVVIPDIVGGCSVGAVAADAFRGCGHLTDISLPGDVYVQEGALDYCPLAQVNYRDTHTLIIWADSGSTEFYGRMIEEYLAAHEEYAEWSFRFEEFGADEAGNVFYSAVIPDVYTLPQDQIRGLWQGNYLYPADLSALEGQDAAAVEGALVDGQAYAYPISSDNGYFLYYDPAIVTDPSDLDQILADCEAGNAVFAMDMSSGWYNVSFFFGAGCKVEYPGDGESNITVATDAGRMALKAMIRCAASPSFINTSAADSAFAMAEADGKTLGAIVTGTWDSGALSGFACAKLPEFDGCQMGSFSGNRYLGVCYVAGWDRLELAGKIAALLSGEEAQAGLYAYTGYIPSRAAARSRVSLGPTAAALADQNRFATPQGAYPSGYWDYSYSFGMNIVNGEYAGFTDSELDAVLRQYQADLESVAE